MAVRLFVVLVLVSTLVAQIFGATIVQKREADEEGEMCKKLTPCGWAIYNRSTRVVEYFMKNKCHCPDTKTCTRTDDDITVTAYIYRCK